VASAATAAAMVGPSPDVDSMIVVWKSTESLSMSPERFWLTVPAAQKMVVRKSQPTPTEIGARKLMAALAARRVQLVVASGQRTPKQVSDVLGSQPDRETWEGRAPEGSTRARPARENTWELRESGDGNTDVSELLARIFDRIYPLRDGLELLRQDGSRIILSVVLYVSPSDPTGPGFVLTDTFIGLLAKIGANFEVDQYADS
jgi:hypothetical protein